MSERDERVVRMDTKLYALVSEMYGLLAHMEGMRSENAQAMIESRDLPHNGASFGYCTNEFDKLAKRFRTEI